MTPQFLKLQATYDQFDSEVRWFWKNWTNLPKKKRKASKKEMKSLLKKWAVSTMLNRDIAENIEKYGNKNEKTT